MITKINLSVELENSLIEYCDTILTDVNSYINFNKLNKDHLKTDDLTDCTIPCISDDFILNHDLSSLNYNTYLLDTCLYANIYNISFPPISISSAIISELTHMINCRLIEPSGSFLYPKGGYMGWHTNSNSPGIRVYISYSQSRNGSCFKYMDINSKSVITDWDNIGLTIRIFKIYDDKSKYFWHCVSAPGADRISFGYKFAL